MQRLISFERKMHGSKDWRLLLCGGRAIVGKDGTFNYPQVDRSC
jgi:hypothetical protein